MLLTSKTRVLRPALAAMASVTLLAACASSHSSTSTPGNVPGPAAMPPVCTKAGPVVFAVSGRRDSPAPAVTSRMQAALQTAVTQNSAIGLVNVDGTPKLIAAGSAAP